MTYEARVERDLEVARKLMGPDSEEDFGSGFLQQLFYFSAHLTDDRARAVHEIANQKKNPCDIKLLPARAAGLISAFGVDKALAEAVTLCMNGATDHLYSLVIPEGLPEEIETLIDELKRTAHPLRLNAEMRPGPELYEDFCKLESLIKTIIRMVDAVYFGVLCDPGRFQ